MTPRAFWEYSCHLGSRRSQYTCLQDCNALSSESFLEHRSRPAFQIPPEAARLAQHYPRALVYYIYRSNQQHSFPCRVSSYINPAHDSEESHPEQQGCLHPLHRRTQPLCCLPCQQSSTAAQRGGSPSYITHALGSPPLQALRATHLELLSVQTH